MLSGRAHSTIPTHQTALLWLLVYRCFPEPGRVESRAEPLPISPPCWGTWPMSGLLKTLVAALWINWRILEELFTRPDNKEFDSIPALKEQKATYCRKHRQGVSWVPLDQPGFRGFTSMCCIQGPSMTGPVNWRPRTSSTFISKILFLDWSVLQHELFNFLI